MKCVSCDSNFERRLKQSYENEDEARFMRCNYVIEIIDQIPEMSKTKHQKLAMTFERASKWFERNDKIIVVVIGSAHASAQFAVDRETHKDKTFDGNPIIWGDGGVYECMSCSIYGWVNACVCVCGCSVFVWVCAVHIDLFNHFNYSIRVRSISVSFPISQFNAYRFSTYPNLIQCKLVFNSTLNMFDYFEY